MNYILQTLQYLTVFNGLGIFCISANWTSHVRQGFDREGGGISLNFTKHVDGSYYKSGLCPLHGMNTFRERQLLCK
jgi:hypothetical protein